MPPALTFSRATQSNPGTVYAILSTCFAEILDASLEQSLHQFDHEVARHPDTVGACTLITSLVDEILGLITRTRKHTPAQPESMPSENSYNSMHFCLYSLDTMPTYFIGYKHVK